MTEQFETIKNQIYFSETVIEKSRFLAYAKGVESVDDAVDFVKSIKKKHYDATHNCSAYIFDDKMKFDDDGEPQGTAGLPILETVKNKNLNRLCVVVTRYFGGIKLGAGGLVRAYSSSCASVLSVAEVLHFQQCTRFCVTISYSLLKPLERALAGLATVENTKFDSNVTLICLVLTKNYDTISDIVLNLSSGTAKIEQIEQTVCHFEGNNATVKQ